MFCFVTFHFFLFDSWFVHWSLVFLWTFVVHLNFQEVFYVLFVTSRWHVVEYMELCWFAGRFYKTAHFDFAQNIFECVADTEDCFQRGPSAGGKTLGRNYRGATHRGRIGQRKPQGSYWSSFQATVITTLVTAMACFEGRAWKGKTNPGNDGFFYGGHSSQTPRVLPEDCYRIQTDLQAGGWQAGLRHVTWQYVAFVTVHFFWIWIKLLAIECVLYI